MSCPRSTASTESAAIRLCALGWPWVAAWQAPEDAAVAHPVGPKDPGAEPLGVLNQEMQ
jgi:hypothetical protein